MIKMKRMSSIFQVSLLPIAVAGVLAVSGSAPAKAGASAIGGGNHPGPETISDGTCCGPSSSFTELELIGLAEQFGPDRWPTLFSLVDLLNTEGTCCRGTAYQFTEFELISSAEQFGPDSWPTIFLLAYLINHIDCAQSALAATAPTLGVGLMQLLGTLGLMTFAAKARLDRRPS